jgi:hypothetical protein
VDKTLAEVLGAITVGDAALSGSAWCISDREALARQTNAEWLEAVEEIA